MRRLELRQGLSYAVKGFSCVKGVPFDVDDDAARRLLSTGRFEELPVADDDAGGTDSEKSDDFMKLFWSEPAEKTEDTNKEPDGLGFVQENTEPPMQIPVCQENTEPPMAVFEQSVAQELSADRIAKLKKPELEALAAERNIDISGCNNNEERAAKICGVLGLAGMVQMGLEI